MQVLVGTLAEVAQHIGYLHKLIDNIALLDMLCSLATVANKSCEPYVVPECTQSGCPSKLDTAQVIKAESCAFEPPCGLAFCSSKVRLGLRAIISR